MTAIPGIEQAKVQIREMLKAEKYPQARMFASQLLKKHGADADLLYLRGMACARRAANDQAIKDLRAAIALRPRRVDYYLTLSNILFTSGRFEAALIELFRVRRFAATHPRVRAYGRLISPRNGKLETATTETEAALNSQPDDTVLINRLASLYFVSALYFWHARSHKNGLAFVATSETQIERARHYLARLRALPVATHTVRTKKSKLEQLIRSNAQRRYDGFAGDVVLAAVVMVIGVTAGGFVDLWYAFSAAASFAAFRRPMYLYNRPPATRPATLKGRFAFLLDMAYAAHINDTHSLFRGIANTGYRALAADSVRALLRAAIMPVTTLSGFHTNYSAKHAAAFLAGSVLLSYMLSL